MNKQTNLDISRALKTNDVKNNYNHSNQSISTKMSEKKQQMFSRDNKNTNQRRQIHEHII